MEYTNINTPVDVENQPFSFISDQSKNNQKTKKNNENPSNNNKKNNYNNNYLNKYFNPINLYSKTINVASLNIRGGLESKMINLIDYMITYDIHFLHLCKTHKKDVKNSLNNNNDFQQNNKNSYRRLNHIQFTHTPSNQNFIIIHNPDPENPSSGISIIISPVLYKHLGPIEYVPGRMIHAFFYFKKHHQLNIINLYLPPLTSNNINFNTLHQINKYILQQINKANKYNYFILMGNFNINPHHNKLYYKNNNDNDLMIDSFDHCSNIPKHYYHKQLLNILKNNFYKDLIKRYLNPPPPTFSNHNSTSYIDIIFGSPNIINYIIYGNIVDAPVDTDHKLIYISINNYFFTNPNNFINNSNDNIELNNKKHTSLIEKINYKKINTSQWMDFHNFVWDEFSRLNSQNIYDDSIQISLNTHYEAIQQIINRTIKSLNFPIIKTTYTNTNTHMKFV
ncbi:hypothetical protein RhiirB3_448712 [Rhizophagus irregularis]|nr:hypothetical protein RhiirB3_448712 [Rhizophagus irregularis]